MKFNSALSGLSSVIENYSAFQKALYSTLHFKMLELDFSKSILWLSIARVIVF